MAITFDNGQVIELIRGIVASELLVDGDNSPLIVPDDYVLSLFRFDRSILPLTVLRVKDQIDKFRRPGMSDISHFIKVWIYHVRARSSSDGVTEDVAAERIDSFGAYFARNYRLGGNVQLIEVTDRQVGRNATVGVDFIPNEVLSGLCVALIEVQICWIENLVTS